MEAAAPPNTDIKAAKEDLERAKSLGERVVTIY